MKGIVIKTHKDYISKLIEIEKIKHVSNEDYIAKKEDLKIKFNEHLSIVEVKRFIYFNLNELIRCNNKKIDKLYSVLDKRFKILNWFIYLSVFIFISYSYFKPFFDYIFLFIKKIVQFNHYTIGISYFLLSIPILMIYLIIIFVLFKILEKLIPFMDALFFLYFYKSIKILTYYVYSLNKYSYMTFFFKVMKFISVRLYIIRISYFLMLFLLILLVKKD